MVQIGDYEFVEDRYYHQDHIWVKLPGEGGNVAMIGIDAMGFAIAGKISMIRVKKSGKPLDKGKAFGTMESGKGVVPLKAPISATIVDVNPLLEDKKFGEIMENPMDAWLVKVEISDPSELDQLMKEKADIVKWAKEELAKVK